jgi:hypothetical protein
MIVLESRTGHPKKQALLTALEGGESFGRVPADPGTNTPKFGTCAVDLNWGPSGTPDWSLFPTFTTVSYCLWLINIVMSHRFIDHAGSQRRIAIESADREALRIFRP